MSWKIASRAFFALMAGAWIAALDLYGNGAMLLAILACCAYGIAIGFGSQAASEEYKRRWAPAPAKEPNPQRAMLKQVMRDQVLGQWARDGRIPVVRSSNSWDVLVPAGENLTRVNFLIVPAGSVRATTGLEVFCTLQGISRDKAWDYVDRTLSEVQQ